jgi:hypothetical protein
VDKAVERLKNKINERAIIKELQNRGMMLNKKNQQIIEAEL